MSTRNFTRTPVLAAALAVSLFPCTARAQEMAASFGELRRMLSIGEFIYVTDTAGVTTWGRVTQISEAALTVRVAERIPNRKATVFTDRELMLTEESLGAVRLSDLTGREGALIYPVSWGDVHRLDAGAKVTVVLHSGERRNFRFGSVSHDNLQLLTAAGNQEVLAKSQVERILLRDVDDTPFDGMAVGSAVGAAVTVGFTVMLAASCVGGCDAAEGLPIAFGFGAGLGAGVGWTVDKLHSGTRQVFPVPSVARSRGLAVLPVVSRGHRGLRVSIAF
jgi:hypothetical protein